MLIFDYCWVLFLGDGVCWVFWYTFFVPEMLRDKMLRVWSKADFNCADFGVRIPNFEGVDFDLLSLYILCEILYYYELFSINSSEFRFNLYQSSFQNAAGSINRNSSQSKFHSFLWNKKR